MKSYNIFGLYIPAPIAWLMALVLGMSAGGALLERLGVPVLSYSWLDVEAVWRGQLWRLITWAPLELGPLNLVFGLLLLYFVGPQLLQAWGTQRFFLFYFGGAAITGVLTCLIGHFLWRAVVLVPHTGLWPMEQAMIIAWAVLMPGQRILQFFVLPMSGRNLIAFTIALTFVFAAINGFFVFVPHFIAELLVLVYMDVFSFRRLYLRGRMAMLQRDYKKRTTNLRAVDDRDRDEPPRWTH